MSNPSLGDLITSEQLSGFPCICADGFQLKLQFPDLSAGLSEFCIQLAVFVTKGGNFLQYR